MERLTKAELLSSTFAHAFNVADYRLRHNMLYWGWSDERRLDYKLEKAFDAVIKARRHDLDTSN